MTRVLRHISELATCPPDNPQHDAGLVTDAAMVLEGDAILWIGQDSELPAEYRNVESRDCSGQLVIPGLIDCHTHLCFGGWRSDEFEMRIQGKSYSEIAAAGGGIRHTVQHTRSATTDALMSRARKALDGMLALGVTTVECKSGYGLDFDNEIRQLEIYRALDQQHPIQLVPTFLGAHLVPDEYAEDRESYIKLLCERLLPVVAERRLARFCDVFAERGAFSATEARRILSRAKQLGLGLKVHADQLHDGGGAALAAEVGAVSAEHLEYASTDGIEALALSGTIAVSLPLASLYLRDRYLPARSMLEQGVRVAVATDFNPGSAPSYHLPLAMTLACINQQMTPQEVLMGATSIAAQAIAEPRLGSLLPGYRADYAIVDARGINQWLYHFRPNACIGVAKAGQWLAV